MIEQREREPGAQHRTIVFWIVAAAASSSGLALLLTILTHRPLWLWASFIAVPGLIAVAGLSVWMRRQQETLFLSRLRAGIIAGVVGTAAYDVVRATIEGLHLTSTHTLRTIPIFGAGLTGHDPSTAIAIAAGWGFHIMNGIGFAISFVLLAAGRPIWWGIVFALVLEALTISLYPGWLGFTLNGEFVSVSMLGHVAYGAVLGSIAKRAA